MWKYKRTTDSGFEYHFNNLDDNLMVHFKFLRFQSLNLEDDPQQAWRTEI